LGGFVGCIVGVDNAEFVLVGVSEEGAADGVIEAVDDGTKTEPIKRDRPKVGRNDPCPCGSGLKLLRRNESCR
jgi:hypothetical protein